MSVHVNELHTDIRSDNDGPGERAAGPGGSSTGVTDDQRWLESRGRTAWLARRVAAEDFDD